MSSHSPSDRERGQVLPFVAVVMVLIAGIAVLVAQLGMLAADRAAARSAADAAALAGAAEGEGAARAIAVANRGEMERFHTEGASVEVTVRVGRARATSRATTVPPTLADGAAPP